MTRSAAGFECGIGAAGVPADAARSGPGGTPRARPQGNEYFNRADVKAALHVKDDIDWVICSDTLRYTKNLGSNSYQFYPDLVANYRVRSLYTTTK